MAQTEKRRRRMDFTISPYTLPMNPQGTKRIHGADCTCGWQFVSELWQETATEVQEHIGLHRGNGDGVEVV